MSKNADTNISAKSTHIDSSIVFAHSTISSLAAHLAEFATPSTSTTTKSVVEQHIDEMNTLIERYTADLPSSILKSPVTPAPANEIVLITGTTGALGGLMLSRLLENPKVGQIWAVNRGSRGGKTLLDRQRESFVDKELDTGLLERNVREGRVEFVEAELSSEKLGLKDELYEKVRRSSFSRQGLNARLPSSRAQIRASTTLIIHNAWRLDFNLAVTSFEPYIRGSRNLVDLALSGPHPESARYVFTSSVGTLLRWKDPSVAVPEEPIPDPSISTGNGYGESKYVTEKVRGFIDVWSVLLLMVGQFR